MFKFGIKPLRSFENLVGEKILAIHSSKIDTDDCKIILTEGREIVMLASSYDEDFDHCEMFTTSYETLLQKIIGDPNLQDLLFRYDAINKKELRKFIHEAKKKQEEDYKVREEKRERELLETLKAKYESGSKDA